MELEEIDLTDRQKGIIKEMGIEELYPPQKKALPHIFRDENVLLSVPTASGKSLMGYIAALKAVNRGKKALYIVPLRALAWEKVEELSLFESIGIRIGAEVGDYDTPSRELTHCDIIVATAEKADSLLRHRLKIIQDIGVVVADEVHMITEKKRGPVLEMVLSEILYLNPNCQIIALSATIPNAHDISNWLQAVNISTFWRPVPLTNHIYFDRGIYDISEDGTFLEIPRPVLETGRDLIPLVKQEISEGHQCLVFTNTRRNAMAEARKFAPIVEKGFIKGSDNNWKKRPLILKEEFLDENAEKSEMVEEMAGLIAKGTACHHAGLTYGMRKVIEKGFKDGTIRFLSATPTLATGVNLPARIVIVKHLHRYDERSGMSPLSCLEVRQMCGRAGRPGYDNRGEAFIRASNRNSIDDIVQRYFQSDGETIRSKLGFEGTLRTHLLSSVASGLIRDLKGLKEFIEKTLYFHQKDKTTVLSQLNDSLIFLSEWRFLECEDENGRPVLEIQDFLNHRSSRQYEVSSSPWFTDENVLNVNGRLFDIDDDGRGFINAYEGFRTILDDTWWEKNIFLKTTAFGCRTSQLYIDPLSALNLMTALNALKEYHNRRDHSNNSLDSNIIGIFHSISSCSEMSNLYLRRSEKMVYKNIYFDSPSKFIIPPPSDPSDFNTYLSEIKTASLLNDWISENKENDILKKYNIGPGDIRTRMETADWLLYSMKELAKLTGYNCEDEFKSLLLRIKYGISKNLTPLVRIPNIGRVRARALFNYGFTDIEKIRNADSKVLSNIKGIGENLAESIKTYTRDNH